MPGPGAPSALHGHPPGSRHRGIAPRRRPAGHLSRHASPSGTGRGGPGGSSCVEIPPIEAVAQLVALVCQVASRSACWPALRLVSWENSLMGYNFAGGGDDDQVFLMPPDPRDWLPPQHLAWAMRRAARELDLALFLAACRADGQGNTAYHPRMMVALVMY